MDTDDDGRAAHDKKEKREKKEKKRDEGADIVEEGDWCFDDKRFKGPRAHSEFLSAVYHYLKMTHGKEALETLDFEEVQRYYDDNFSAASQLWGEDDLIDAWLLHLKKKRRKEEKKARKSADPADQSPAAADAPAAQPDADSRMSPSPPPPPPPPATPESIRDTLALSFPQELLDRFIEDNGDECLTALPLSELVSILNEEVESERQRLQQREQEAHADPSAAMYDSEDSSEYSDDADVSVPAHTASSTLAHLGRDDQTKVESLMSIITGLSEEDALSVYMRHNKNVHAAAAELLDM
eukprot:TRINITY_DN24261_c1_g1_i2.p1 TRINITY_DN24261_c1_g1~~TRINITY_DN24261_c1_g1_i2.p1  ORF type:complete len:297 (+),score=83.61 TRINITY_DN24261_c1_g1_i2:138-1028(+)